MYDREYICEDSKVFTEALVKCLVGKGPGDSSYSSWNKDAAHRQQAKTLGIMREIWPENNSPLPWRLTREQRHELNRRMGRIV